MSKEAKIFPRDAKAVEYINRAFRLPIRCKRVVNTQKLSKYFQKMLKATLYQFMFKHLASVFGYEFQWKIIIWSSFKIIRPFLTVILFSNLFSVSLLDFFHFKNKGQETLHTPSHFSYFWHPHFRISVSICSWSLL